MKLIGLLVLLGFLGAFAERSAKDTLILIDSVAVKETHSIFFKTLSDRGYNLVFKLADDPNLTLSKYGQYIFKNLIIFAPSVEEFGGSISVDVITQFIDDGGNVLVAGSTNTGSALRELATECGFELDEENSAVVDHINYDVSDTGNHDKLVIPPTQLIQSKYIAPSPINPLLYYGTGILLDKSNPLILQIMSADKTSYSYKINNSIKEYPHVVGKSTTLIAGLQARNNARVVFSGSLFFFSDEALTSSVQSVRDSKNYDISGNRALVVSLSEWAFGESGHLRVTSVKHNLQSSSTLSSSYTVLDPVVFSIQIEIFESGTWKPYNANDIQLEFVRIDPFVRVGLKMKEPGKYEAKFNIPDIYGVYQFKVQYEKLGLSYLHHTTQVPVRPLKHTQYERFIASAFPYYCSAFSMIVGVVLLSFVMLHFNDTSTKQKTQ